MYSEFKRGFKAALPVAVSVAAYGSVLGVLASQRGIDWLTMVYMNTSVFAGAAQFVMVDMWGGRLPLVEMTLAVLVINLRYLLIGASLDSLFQGYSLGHKLCMMHLVADENWALTMADVRRGPSSTYFLLGGGVCAYLAWSCGTLGGLLGGSGITNPEVYALDFAFTAVFTSLAVGLWQGKRDVLPWLVAAVLAFVAERYLPGKWYIVVGGVGGAIAAMFGPLDDEEMESGAGKKTTGATNV